MNHVDRRNIISLGSLLAAMSRAGSNNKMAQICIVLRLLTYDGKTNPPNEQPHHVHILKIRSAFTRSNVVRNNFIKGYRETIKWRG